jgi:hypothetical protein
MNNVRRKQLREIISKLTDNAEEIRSVASEEEDYRDNMHENLHGSEKHDKADIAASDLNEAADSIDAAIGLIEGAIE